MRRSFTSAVAALLLVGCDPGAPRVADVADGGGLGDGEVFISTEAVPDSGLRAAIVRELVLTEVGSPDELISLNASNRQIRDLTGVGALSGLRSLDLSFNQIATIDCLASLSDLEFLDLTGNRVSDLGPLSCLEKLRVLSVSSNPVTDLGPVLVATDLLSLSIEDIGSLGADQTGRLQQLEAGGTLVQGSGFGGPPTTTPVDPVEEPIPDLIEPLPESVILFISTRGDASRAIYSMNVDDPERNVRRVVSLSGTSPLMSISPDRRRIGLSMVSPIGIFLMDHDGSNIESITAEGLEPAWSPRGDAIAFRAFVRSRGAQASSIHVIDLGNGEERVITEKANRSGLATPSWSPTGDSLLVADFSADPFEISLISLVEMSSGTRHLVTAGLGPVWSPDGTRFAFHRDDQIWIHDLKTGDETQLTGLGTNATPSWSPDGTRLVFASQRLGNYDVYLINADGTGERRLTLSVAFDYEPTWSSW